MMQKTLCLSFLTSLLLCFSLFTNAQDCLQLELATANVIQGEQVCLPVKVKNFQDIIGFQFSINWEGDQLNYANLIELNEDIGISLSNFGTPNSGLDEGNLTVSWTSPSLTPVSLPDIETLFSVCLDVVGDGSLVTFGDSPTVIEILDENLEILPVGFLNGKASATEPIDLVEVEDICADVLTCQSPATTLSVEVIGGTLPYTYLWDGPNGYFASDQNPTVNEEGQYKLLVTDAEGYSASALYNVIADLQDDFISNVVIQNAGCATDDGSITLEMVGDIANYSFLWSNGADNSNSIQDLAPGDYSVTVLDWISACVVEETYTVATESFITGFSYECEFLPDTTMATITSVIWSGGNPPYTFDWSNGDSQVVNMDFPVSSIYVGADGTYSLTITDANGCSDVYTDITADCGVVSDDLAFNVSSANADVGDQVCVDISVDNFTDIMAAQFSVNYNPNNLEFESVGNFGLPNLNESVMGLPGAIDPGNITVSWIDPELNGVSVPNGTVLFELCFTALAEGTTDVAVTGTPLSIEVIDSNSEIVETSQNAGTVDIGSGSTIIAAAACNVWEFPDSTVAEISVIVWGGGVQPYTFEWSDGYTSVDSIISINNFDCQDYYSLTITDATGVSEVLTNLGEDCDCGGSSDDVSINVSSANVDAGDQFCVDVSVDNFTNILGIQGTIEWDEALMSFDEVNSTGVLAGIAFGTNGFPDEGKMSYSWVDADLSSETLADGTAIFEMCFTALAEGTSLVSPSSDPTPIEFIDNTNTEIPYNTNFGTVQIGANNQLIGGVSYECEVFPDSLAITLSAVAWTGTPPFTFDWSTGESEQSDFLSAIVVNEENVLYGVTITDATGLTYVDNNILPICGSTQPEFTVGVSCEHTVYPDSTVVDLSVLVWAGGTPPYTFEWSNGFTEVNGSISTLTYTCPGTYSLTITDSDGYSEVLEDVTDNCDCDNSGDADVELSIDHGVGETGDQVCVSVRAEVFDDIMGIQYSLTYDPDVVTLATIEPKDLPALTIGNFGFVNVGVVTMSWIDPTLSGVSLDAGTALYELCFDIVGDIGTSTEILFGNIPTPIEFTNNANQVVSFQGSNGSITVAENVWPGDSDNSELVTNVDLLNIGLGYGLTGPARPETGTNWQGYGAFDWDQSTPQSNINYKNADANGDGIISALDANAILNNYGEETNFWDGDEDQFFDNETSNLTSPPIFVLPDTVVPGAIVEFPIIMGSDAFPADDIYGVAFTILYDPEVVVPESAFASFGDSWVGMIDDDMLGLYMDFHSQGKIDIAITRTDGMNVSGNGQIGTLHLTIEDVILRSTLYPVEFEVVDVTVIRNDEEPIIITPKKTTMIIDVVNSLNEIPLEELISIFPNPTNDHLFINTNDVNIIELAVHAIDGSLMPLDYDNSNALSLKDLPNGVYLLKVYTDKGILNSRIVKQGH